MKGTEGIQVVVEPLDGGLASVEPTWRRLDRDPDRPSPYLTYDWLAAWVVTYRPDRLALARALDADGATVGLGLIERFGGGRWRFAGRPVTPCRGLRARAGCGEEVWSAFGRWLRAHPRSWSTIDAEGLRTPPSLPRLRLAAVANPRVDLPDSFEEYLAERSPTTRKGLKQKLRRAERAGARVVEVEADGRAGALGRWLALHGARAAAKGERHRGMEGPLDRLLLDLGPQGPVRLRVFELRVDGGTVGVSVRLDEGDTGYFYNSGFNPVYGDISPGVILELGSVRQAIEQGLRHFDLGPGDYRYKRDLGGDATHVLHAEAASRAPQGPAMRSLTDAYGEARRYAGSRRRTRTPTAEAASSALASGSSLAHMLPALGRAVRSKSGPGAPRSAAVRSASSHR